MELTENEYRKIETQKRIELMKQGDKLLETCLGCNIRKENHNYNQDYYLTLCVDCPIYSGLRNVGNEMLKISKERRKRRKVEQVAYARKNLGLKLGNDKRIDDVIVTTNELEIDTYAKLKSEGLSDTSISKQFGVHRNQLIRWKKRNNIERMDNKWRPSIPKKLN